MASNNLPDRNLSDVRGSVATPEEIARRDGYVQGRNDENHVQRNMRAQERIAAQSQANDSATSGLLMGVLIALIATGAGAALYFANVLTGENTNVIPIAVPQTEKETTQETTIIEREVSSPEVSLPDVQIDVPEVTLPDINVPNGPTEPAAVPQGEPAIEPAGESTEEGQ